MVSNTNLWLLNTVEECRRGSGPENFIRSGVVSTDRTQPPDKPVQDYLQTQQNEPASPTLPLPPERRAEGPRTAAEARAPSGPVAARGGRG